MTAVLRETELLDLVADLFANRRKANVEKYVPIGEYRTVDLLIEYEEANGPTTLLVEVKANMPRTSHRLAEASAQLRQVRLDVEARRSPLRRRTDPILALVIPGTLPRAEYESFTDLRLIDGVAIIYLAREEDDSLQERVREALARKPDETLDDIQHRLLLRVDGLPDLERIPGGLSNWSEYQRGWRDVLASLFVPPLEPPDYEHVNESKVNRRDIIFANYATSGFWEFLRNQYCAEFIVVDAKNAKGYVTKTHVLQMANYLSVGGLGLFGLIVCRNGLDQTARAIRKEQWLLHRKMILVLTHADLREMVHAQFTGEGADIILRQKLQDFRLSV